MNKIVQVVILLVTWLILSNNISAQWVWQNPLPQGHTLNGVFFSDANTGAAVGDFGTILRTTDGGLTWTLQTSGTTNVLRSVFFTDTNTGTVVGANGTILRTTDGGSTWTLQTSGTTQFIQRVAFTDASTGTAVGSGGTILRTTDGGSTWTAQTSGSTWPLYGISFSNDSTITVVGGMGTILRTTNSGATWTAQTSGTTNLLYSVAFTDPMKGTTVGGTGLILQTTDGGGNWVPQPSGTTKNFVDVSFTDANTGTAVGFSGTICHTTDGGATWVVQSSGTLDGLYGVFLTNANTGTVVGVNGKILQTIDGGLNWTTLSFGTTNTLNDVSFTDASTGTAVGNTGTIVSTTNGGSVWKTQLSGTTNTLWGVSCVDANIVTAVGNSGTILRTIDGGGTWVAQSSGTTSNLYSVAFTDANKGTVVGFSGKILQTTDGGSTWIEQVSGTTEILWRISFIDANIGTAVGNSGKILRTTDGGVTWALQTSGTTNILRGVNFSDSNNGTAVGFSGTILRTTDGGTIWTAQTSGTTSPLYDVFFSDASTGTVVGDAGRILYTTDGGSTWTQQSSGTGKGLNSVFFNNASTAIVVGAGGTILRKGGLPLVAPSNLIAVADTFFVDLSWADNSDNEIGFKIERKDDSLNISAPWILVDSVGANITVYSDTGLTPNTTYSYRIYAYNLVGESAGDSIETTTLPLEPTTFPLTVNIDNGWNMVSVPGLHPVNQNVTTWWSGKDPAANVFIYNSGYQQVTAATPCEGYWMKNLGAQIYNTGDEWPAGGILFVPHNPIDASADWNLIGGYEYNAPVNGITTNPPALIQGSIFKYSGGYQTATELVPGYGYWVKLSGPGEIILPPPTFKGLAKLTDNAKTDWGKIIVTDNSGKSYILYAVNDELTLADFDLPPVPPSGIFDVRYGSGRYAENISTGKQSIDMTGIEYPVNIKAENINITLQDESGKEVFVELKSGEQVTVINSTINKLMILSGEILSPTVYALEQNYPNPFNPSTTIKFSLPEGSANVKITIYNSLGEKVIDLVNGKLDAGIYSYKWDAGNVSSGLYIYQIVTEKFVSSKKMMFLK